MPISVELPGGATAEFPDEMQPDAIQAVLRKQFAPAIPAPSAPVEKPESSFFADMGSALESVDLPPGGRTIVEMRSSPEYKRVAQEPLFKIAEVNPEYEKYVTEKGTPEDKRILGYQKGIFSTLNSLTSPNNLELMAATGGLAGIAKVLPRLVGLAFAAHMGKTVSVDIANELGREYAKPADQRDEAKIGELISSGIAQAGLASTIGAKSLAPTKPGVTLDARQDRTPAQVYGDVRPQPEQGPGQVPVQEGSPGVQLQGETAQALPEVLTTAPEQRVLPEGRVPAPERLAPEQQAAEIQRLDAELGQAPTETPSAAQKPPSEPSLAPEGVKPAAAKENAPQGQITPPESISDAWRMYDEAAGIDTPRDLADYVQGLIADNRAPRSLQRVVDRYQKAVEEDFRMAGRSDLDAAEEAFLTAIEKEANKPQKAQKAQKEPHVIRSEEIGFEQPFTSPPYRPITDAEAADLKALSSFVTKDARIGGARRKETSSNRLLVLQDKADGTVHVVSVWPHGRYGAIAVDPAKAGSIRSGRQLGSLLDRYKPLYSILSAEPKEKFYQKFDSLADYQSQFGEAATQAMATRMGQTPTTAGKKRGTEAPSEAEGFTGYSQAIEPAVPEVYGENLPEVPTSAELSQVYSVLKPIAGKVTRESLASSLRDLAQTGKGTIGHRQLLSAVKKMAQRFIDNEDLTPKDALGKAIESLHETAKSSASPDEFQKSILRSFPEGPRPSTQAQAPGQGPQGIAGATRSKLANEPLGSEAGFITFPDVAELRGKLEDWRRSIASKFKAGISSVRATPVRHIMDQTFDAADNMAHLLGRQMANRISVGISDIHDRAASAMIESGFDRNQLATMIKSLEGSKSPSAKDAKSAIQYALDNFDAVKKTAALGKGVFDRQIFDENNHNINTVYAENYVPSLINTDLWMGTARPYVLNSRGANLRTGFKKGKTYAGPFDAVANGEGVRTLKLSELVDNRVRAGQKLINRVEWSDSLRDITDPSDQQPIVTSLVKHSREGDLPDYQTAPAGYVPRSIIPGVDIAVHEGYTPLFDALTGTSKIREFEPRGIPVGTLILEGEGAIKHGLLLFDTFHVSRILQKQLFLTGKIGYRKGLSLLEYSNADLGRAVQAGEITQKMADFARANRPEANLLIQEGLMVGRIQEGIYSSFARKLPIIGSFNKWTFEKMTRGAMLQAALIEFRRLKAANPTLSDRQVARSAVRDANAYFGNLGRQGIFKSPTFIDLANMIALAPQWFESMARTEIGGAKQLAIDPILKRRLAIGTLGAGVSRGLLAYFVGTQLLNLATRHQFTWQNPEPEHKLDAWIPDVTGKSPGFFISPFSVVAELTHDMIRYSHSEPDTLAAVSKILSNKASPVFRAAKILFGGRDWDGSKIVGSWEKAKKAAVALVPTPIPAQPFTRTSPPGQAQRQITASLGFKTEPAPSAQAQIFDLVDRWKAATRDPKFRAQLERRDREQMAPSDYRPLKQALIRGDMKAARTEFQLLIENKGKAEADIDREFQHPKPFGGSKQAENSFFDSLTPEQQAIFLKAKQEQEDLLNLYIKMREATE